MAKITPGATAVNGAATALLIVGSILFITSAIYGANTAKDPRFLAFFIVFTIACVLGACLILWILKKYNSIPENLKIAL